MVDVTTEGAALSEQDVFARSRGAETLPDSELLLNRQYKHTFVSGRYEIEIEPREQSPIGLDRWISPTVEALCAKLQLEPNWDSYGALKIDKERVWKAIRVLLEVMSADTEAPWVVPTSDGGIQLEWHREDEDLEVEISGSREATVYFESRRTDDEWERPLDESLPALRHLLAQSFIH